MWLLEAFYVKAMFSDKSTASIAKLSLRSACIYGVKFICFLIDDDLSASWLWKKLRVLLAIMFYHIAFKVDSAFKAYTAVFLQLPCSFFEQCNTCRDPFCLNWPEWISPFEAELLSVKWRHQMNEKHFFNFMYVMFFSFWKRETSESDVNKNSVIVNTSRECVFSHV